MGFVTFSIPKDLVIKLVKTIEFENFIETGTFEGSTSFWAADYFKNVFTIEIDEKISKTTAMKPGCPPNINFLIGNSKNILPKIVTDQLKGRSFFWLDGHWCAGGGGKDEECPLMYELDAIKNTKGCIIFIDDARCFLGPLPPPHDSSHWPGIDDIFEKLKAYFPNHFTTIQDDVIMCVPPDAKHIINKDWQEKFDERFKKANSKEQKLSRKQHFKKAIFGN